MNFTSNQYQKYNDQQSQSQRRHVDQRRQTDNRRPQPFCPICKKNGKTEAEYNSHFIRETSDENSPITCPVLLNMECNHCGKKGHMVAKCPDKRCVYCNEYGHTVSRCIAAPKEVIDRFLDERHQTYVNRGNNASSYSNRTYDLKPVVSETIVPLSVITSFEDAPSLSKKPVNKVETVFNYSNVAKTASALPAPKPEPKHEPIQKIVSQLEYEDDSEDEVVSVVSEYVESSDDEW